MPFARIGEAVSAALAGEGRGRPNAGWGSVRLLSAKLREAVRQLEALNAAHPRPATEAAAAPRFILLHRARRFSDTERRWIGWERKRGKLEQLVNVLAGGPAGDFIDLGELKRILNRAIVDKSDHRNLNDEVPFLRGIIPSTENLVIAFWQQIAPHIQAPATLHCVRLYETPRNYAEYFGS